MTEPMPEPTVILSRPRPQSEAFARRLEGLTVVIAPVVEIVPLAVDVDPARFELILLASQNAVRAARGLNLAGCRALAVGAQTARAAAAEGMRARAAGGDADALVAAVLAERPAGPVLFLRGRHSRGRVAERLAAAGLDVTSAVVYDQRPRPLGSPARRLLAGKTPLILPVFSPRSARLLGDECGSDGPAAPFSLVAISPAARDAWTGRQPASVTVAAAPTAEAMAQAIRRQAQMRP